MNRVRGFFLSACVLFACMASQANPSFEKDILWTEPSACQNEVGDKWLSHAKQNLDAAPDAYEEDDSWEQSRLMELGTLQERNFYDDGVDWVKLTFKKGVKYQIETDVYGDCDTRLQLAINYTDVAENDNKSSSEKGSRIIYQAQMDSNAYLKIMSKNGKTGLKQAYDLFLFKSGDSKPEKAKNWTSLIYMDASAQEDEAYKQDLREMELVGSHPLYHVALLLKTKNSAAYYILENNRMVLKQDLGTLKTSHSTSGKNFLDWAVRSCPARQYMFTFYGEGMGADRGIFPDNSTECLTEKEQAEILLYGVNRIGRKFGVVGYDMGLMASGELFYQMRNVADYVVASEQTVLPQHWNYEFLDGMKDANLKPIDFVRHMIMCFEDTYNAWTDLTISAVDCSKSAAFMKGLDDFSRVATSSGVNGQIFCDLVYELPSFGLGKTRDLSAFLAKVEASTKLPQTVKDKANELRNMIIKDYVVMAWHGNAWYQKAFGVSMVMKANSPIYSNHDLCAQTHWNEFCDFAKFPSQ